jgi:DNA ligase 4
MGEQLFKIQVFKNHIFFLQRTNFLKIKGEKTYCVLTSKLIHKVNIYITKDSYDVVKTDWLIKCIENKIYYPWTPSDMFHSTKKTREYFSGLFDKYGDHYDANVDLDKLKAIFVNMNNNVEINNQDIHLKIAFIENKYFPDESSEYGLFRLCNVYLDLYENIDDHERKIIFNSSLDLIKVKLIWFGSDISTKINDSTTHCVLDKRF